MTTEAALAGRTDGAEVAVALTEVEAMDTATVGAVLDGPNTLTLAALTATGAGAGAGAGARAALTGGAGGALAGALPPPPLCCSCSKPPKSCADGSPIAPGIFAAGSGARRAAPPSWALPRATPRMRAASRKSTGGAPNGRNMLAVSSCNLELPNIQSKISVLLPSRLTVRDGRPRPPRGSTVCVTVRVRERCRREVREDARRPRPATVEVS